MTTIISAFINIPTNQNRNFEKYKEYGIKLLNLDINKIIFLDEKIYHIFEEYQNDKTILIKTSLDDLYLYKYKEKLNNLQVNTNNPTKDCFDYFAIQCNKTEWMREGILLNQFSTSHFMWIDFGIHHVLSNELTINNCCFTKNYNKVRIPNIWNLDKEYNCDYNKDILWYFAGGVFGGSSEKLLLFADLTKNKCIDLLEKENHIMWEVNIWYLVWKENKELFDNYKADHNNSIIMNY